MKNCSKCKQEKSLDEFSPNKQTQDKKSSWCKSCYILYRQKYPWKKTYDSIKQRCNNSKATGYKNYGGRGIKCLITANEVKQIWFRDKGYLMKKPSIDRKENNGNYTFENCQFMEKSANTAKQDKTKQMKSINQYDSQGNFIKNWKSGLEIQRALGFNCGNVSNVCTGKRKTTNGFIWRFKGYP